MGATEGSAAVPMRELNLFFYRVDAVDPSHPPARPSSDVPPIAGSSPTPLLNPPSSATSQTMLSDQRMSAGPKSLSTKLLKGRAAVEHLPADGKMAVPALWKTPCLVPKKQASKDSQ